jgi:hypothetical protein
MPLIYKLYDELDCYVGSTIETLKIRLGNHIRCRNCKSVVILDRKKFTMELIEEVETKDRFKREQYWIDRLSTLSQIKCYFESEEEKIKYQTENYKEYVEKNKEKISERNKNWRGINKEKISLKEKQYREINRVKFTEKFTCDCGGIYTYKHTSTHLKTKKHLAYICEKEKNI